MMPAPEQPIRRPAPDSAYRAELRGRLSEQADREPWCPRRPVGLALAYVGSGLALLAIAAAGVAGFGPLA